MENREVDIGHIVSSHRVIATKEFLERIERLEAVLLMLIDATDYLNSDEHNYIIHDELKEARKLLSKHKGQG